MKKIIGVSILSAMLVLGQPLMAFADTTKSTTLNPADTTKSTTLENKDAKKPVTLDDKDAKKPVTLNFEDIEGIVLKNNLEVHINANDRLKSEAVKAHIKKTVRDLENDLDDIRDQKNSNPGIPGMASVKQTLLDTLEQVERNAVDLPTSIAIADLQASMSDDTQTLTAESLFIGYNQLKYSSADIALSIDALEDQLATMELRVKLGLISYNTMNDLKTQLVDMQTKQESTKLQQDLMARKLKILLNDQENTLVIGSIPSEEEDFIIEDQKDDLKIAFKNNYTIKLMEQQLVILQATLERAQEDHGMSSYQYKQANYELANAKLKLTQTKDTLNSDYYTSVDNIAKMESNLELAKQTLADKMVALSEAQIRMKLGMLSQLELDNAVTAYNVQDNAVRTKQIELFNAQRSYEWLLRGMPASS